MAYLLPKHLHGHQPQQIQAAGCAAWQTLLQRLDSVHTAVFSSSSSRTQAEPARGTRKEQTTRSNNSCLTLNLDQRQSCSTLGQRRQLGQHQQHSSPVDMNNPCQQQQQQRIMGFLPLTWRGNTTPSVLQASSLSATLQPPSCKLITLQDTLFPSQQPHLLQQQQRYHRSQHRARLLTTELQRKSCWQDLQQAFDARGSGGALNAIHLTTMLLQLLRVAPKAGLVPANERQQLQQFTQELVAACHSKLHRMDHRGLSSYIQSLTALGYNLHQQPLTPAAAAAAGRGDQQQELVPQCSGDNDSNSNSTMLNDILQAVVKHIPQADAQSCAAVASSLATMLQQQQQQQQQQAQETLQQEDQQQLLHKVTSVLLHRIYDMAVMGHMTADKACQVCFSAARLVAAVRARMAAAAGTATSTAGIAISAAGAARSTVDVTAATSTDTSAVPDAMSAIPDATSAAESADLAANLRSLVLLTAQQVAAAVTAATTDTLLWREPLITAQDAGLLLSSLAKSRAWPGWDTLLLLLQQYSWGVAAAVDTSASPYAVSTAAYSSSRNKMHKHGSSATAVNDSSSAAAAAAAAESATDQVLRSLPPMIWALGRLLEQDQQHQQHRRKQMDLHHYHQQLQCYIDMWQTLDSCILASSHQITAATPAQLAQLIAGLCKVVAASGHVVMKTRACIQADMQLQPKQYKLAAGGGGILEPVVQMQQAVAAEAAPQGNKAEGSSDYNSTSIVTDGQQVSVAPNLEQLHGKLKHHLESSSLQELLRLHVATVERMLPLMPVDVRLQIADCYRQLGLQLPQAVSVVFGRDAAQAVAKQTQLWHV